MQINAKRLLDDLHCLREFGAESTGCVRPAFSEAEIASRRWLATRFEDAGLTVHWDPVGNLFGLPAGDGPFLLSGSHSDTQPEGGWLDGAFGVIAALEAARSLAEQGHPPIAVVSFQDEEGRFGGLSGSTVWSGGITLEEADRITDAGGLSFGEARARMKETHGASFLPFDRFKGFIEIHIEQGPVLDQSGQSVAVVDRIAGNRQWNITLKGEQNHAGTTPMPVRRDAFQGLVEVSAQMNASLPSIADPATVWTVGRVAISPNAPSVVPGEARFVLQWRDPQEDRLDQIDQAVENILNDVSTRRGLELTIQKRLPLRAVQLDPEFVLTLEAAAEEIASGNWRRMASGALHDASSTAPLIPTAMLFVPSINGVSHSFAEDTAETDLITGARVLAEGLRRLARR